MPDPRVVDQAKQPLATEVRAHLRGGCEHGSVVGDVERHDLDAISPQRPRRHATPLGVA